MKLVGLTTLVVLVVPFVLYLQVDLCFLVVLLVVSLAVLVAVLVAGLH